MVRFCQSRSSPWDCPVRCIIVPPRNQHGRVQAPAGEPGDPAVNCPTSFRPGQARNNRDLVYMFKENRDWICCQCSTRNIMTNKCWNCRRRSAGAVRSVFSGGEGAARGNGCSRNGLLTLGGDVLTGFCIYPLLPTRPLK
jgi:hypothetical protein